MRMVPVNTQAYGIVGARAQCDLRGPDGDRKPLHLSAAAAGTDVTPERSSGATKAAGDQIADAAYRP